MIKIFRFNDTGCRKLSGLFGCDKSPVMLEYEERTRLETVAEKKCGSYEELNIISSGCNPDGEHFYLAFATTEESLTGSLVLIVTGKTMNMYKLKNCYNEGENAYGQEEWYTDYNTVTFLEHYFPRNLYIKWIVCCPDENSCVIFRIAAEQEFKCDTMEYELSQEKGAFECFGEIYFDGKYKELKSCGQISPETTPEDFFRFSTEIAEEERTKRDSEEEEIEIFLLEDRESSFLDSKIIFEKLDPFTKPLVYKVLFEPDLLDYTLSTVTLELSEDTFVEYGIESIWKEADLIKESMELIDKLKGRCRGLALNLVPADSIVYNDGDVESRDLILNDQVVTRKNGSMAGCIRNNVSVSATVFKPDAKKLRALLRDNLPYDISSVTFGLYIPDHFSCETWNEWMNTILKNFTLIYSDEKEGLVMMLEKDVYLAAKYVAETDSISMKISTRYPFQMSNKLKEKDISDLIDYFIFSRAYDESEEEDE